MSGPRPKAIQQAATDVTFDVLIAAAEAATWAVVAAYPQHALSGFPGDVGRPRDPVEAAYRIVRLADQIVDAVHRHRFLIEIGVPVPDPRQQALPF